VVAMRGSLLAAARGETPEAGHTAPSAGYAGGFKPDDGRV